MPITENEELIEHIDHWVSMYLDKHMYTQLLCVLVTLNLYFALHVLHGCPAMLACFSGNTCERHIL